MKVVVVESPAKAKTINKYLGDGYHVLASYGHVRDLPPKDGSVLPDDDFSMSWEVDARGEKRLREIVAAMKGADHLFLGVTEHPGCGMVPTGDDAIEVLAHNHVFGGFYDRGKFAEALGTRSQFLLGLSKVGDIPHRA